MDAALFNINSGYVDGLVRGLRSDLISNSGYSNLVECESLEDLRLQLSSSPAYAEFINLGKMSVDKLTKTMLNTFVNTFMYLRQQASEPLSQFMDYITYNYMIENVVLLMTGSMNNRDSSELLERCHGLGTFDALPVLSCAYSVEDVYNTVIVDSPLAPYMRNCLSADDLNELNIEIVRNKMYKEYLLDFYRFCKDLGGPTAECMGQILEFEADRRTISITVNSLGTSLSSEEKMALFPTLGRLYPEGQLVLKGAEDIDTVQDVCSTIFEYKDFFSEDQNDSLDDQFYKYECKLLQLAFLQQFNFGVIYAWTKLKEAEIRNITWIAECINLDQKEKINDFVRPF